MAKKRDNSSGAALVVVESPAKAKTIGKYLGDRYKVLASMGHVRDLPSGDLGVDLERDFAPSYVDVPERGRILSDLRKAAKKADTIYLATDLDREGEAIAWHVACALDLPSERFQRVVFNEITKDAIRQAFASPRSIDMDKVNAQQARRILDRIVGYQLSPLLWKKVAKGLSAGRVQSVAVRLIVEREGEIEAFVPLETWRVLAVLATDPKAAQKLADEWSRFTQNGNGDEEQRTRKDRIQWLSENVCLEAELVSINGSKFEPTQYAEAQKIVQALGYVVESVDEKGWEEYAKHGIQKVRLLGRTDLGRTPPFRVTDIQTKRTESKAPAPFTTAALQQSASSQLGFAVSRTMRIAQQLYEGVDLGDGEGPTGLITYMRTDSTNLAAEAVGHLRELIQSDYGDAYLPAKPNRFGSAKRAQEAHEAIRPTSAHLTPKQVAGHLSAEQEKLYNLIWRRTVACQMKPAQWENTTLQIVADTDEGEAVFKASGRRLVFDGYLRVAQSTPTTDVVLPELKQGDGLGAISIEPKQQFTSPPPRYNEASLVKALEAEGIGRPSTYAAIIQTIQDRGYVEQIDRRLFATDKGQIVTEKLVEHFPKVMDLKFTSFMEDELDKIEDSHLDWVHVLNEFYEPFREALDQAHVNMEAARAEPSEYKCPRCGREMAYRWARRGRFLSCTGYPECNGAYNVDREGKPIIPKAVNVTCEVCGSEMLLRHSRLGPFLGCSAYPECTNTMPCDEEGVPLRKVDPSEIKETCDECGAPMAVKFARGRSFLGCTAYPKCKSTKPMPPGVYVEKPKPEEAGVRCDKCGRPMVIRKSRRGPFLSCSGFPRCRNAMPLDKKEHLESLEAEGKIPEPPKEKAGRASSRRTKSTAHLPKTKEGKVDVAKLGPPPPGFAWTRTGRPVVEDWPDEPLTCPDCGSECVLKRGRFGPYYGCTAFPKCSFVANLRGDAKKRAEVEMPAPERPKPIPTDIECPECGQKMLIRTGRSGKFLGCSGYPKCRATQPLPDDLNVPAEPAEVRG